MELAGLEPATSWVRSRRSPKLSYSPEEGSIIDSALRGFSIHAAIAAPAALRYGVGHSVLLLVRVQWEASTTPFASISS